MADDAKAALAKIAKLHAKLVEVKEQEMALLDEIGNLLAGGPGIGALLKRLEHHFSDCWKVRYRAEYVFQHAKDVPQLKRLVKLLGVEETERRMLAYVRNNDQFFTGSRHSFGLFVSTVNQHAGAGVNPSLDLELQGEADQTSRMLGALRASQK